MLKRNNNEMESDNKIYDITQVLDVFGKYQIIQYSLICLSLIFVSMVDINYVFVAGDLDYRCIIPECEVANSTATYPQWWPNWSRDDCSKPILREDAQSGTCTNSSFTNNVEECTEWIYDSSDTIVAELDLACRPWKVNLVGTIHSIGMLLAMIVSGWTSDKYGRKWTLLICTAGTCLGYLKTFASSWHVYVTIEFLESCMSGGTYIPAMILMLEICGTNKRILSGILFSCFIYTGESILAFIAMFFPYWKYIIYIINVPCSLFIFSMFIINESPRWQIVNGKINDAKKNLFKIAKTNNININSEAWKEITAENMRGMFNIKEHEVADDLRTIITSKEIIKRLFVTSVCRFSASLVYYGVIVNSVWLPGDKYLNFFLSSLMSFPGEMLYLYLMNKFGRKIPLQIGFALSSVLSITSGVLNDSYKWTKISLFLTSKMMISACSTGSITYTMELFPTSARGILNGFGAFSSRFGCILAPLTPILNLTSKFIPGICFGTLAALSSMLLILTPETKDQPLMDTVKQVEESVTQKKIIKKWLKGEDNLGFHDDNYVTKL